MDHETADLPGITDEIRRLAELVVARHPAWERHALYRAKTGRFAVRGYDFQSRVLGEVEITEFAD